MRLRALICVVPFLALAGCFVSASPEPAPVVVQPAAADGTLTVEWTINETTDPNQCNQSQADSVQIVVTTTGGAPAGTFEQACGTFATSITLAPGSYSASATLVDASGRPRTTAVDISPFTLYGNDELKTPIDFPASSFE